MGWRLEIGKLGIISESEAIVPLFAHAPFVTIVWVPNRHYLFCTFWGKNEFIRSYSRRPRNKINLLHSGECIDWGLRREKKLRDRLETGNGEMGLLIGLSNDWINYCEELSSPSDDLLMTSDDLLMESCRRVTSPSRIDRLLRTCFLTYYGSCRFAPFDPSKDDGFYRTCIV